MKFNEKLRAARKKVSITQADLASMVGVSLMSIRRYEDGTQMPRTDVLQKIAKALDIPLPSLFFGEETAPGKWEGDFGDNEFAFLKAIEEMQKPKEPPTKKAALNTAFDKLNDTGQEKAVDAVETIAKVDEYRKGE